MNFISLAVSVFISNFIFIRIIDILPFIRRKKIWQGILISLADISSILGYVIILITSLTTNINLTIILEMVGSILGILIGYIAAMMIILDGISLFKSKRLREFERGINQKEGKSLPRNIIAMICLCVSIVLLAYSIITIINYNKDVLISLIGAIIGTLIFSGLSIYFFISGKALYTKVNSSNLILYIKLPDKTVTYYKELSKELTENQILGKIKETYMLDEFGFIITPTTKYAVKGIMVTKLAKDILNDLNMDLLEPNPYQEALSHFQKYNRKKIVLDQNNKITKIIDLK